VSASVTRGFLFADLRGYTSYLDRQGAVAATALLERFRTIVRAAVAAHSGAEIRTEGDSFYVVFPSASVAVACALDILRAAADSAVHEQPIPVGIGVHAGEALETPEGPVGTAVNIAARLCAMARPGEVLVSDTVRALTRSVGHAGFVSVGRRPIKGLDEALAVYRAVPAGTAIAVRGASRSWAQRRYAVPVLAALLIGIGGVSALVFSMTPRPNELGGGNRPALPSPETPPPLHLGSLSPGTYRTVSFQPPFSFSVGGGWSLLADEPDNFFMEYLTRPRGGMGAFRTNVVYLGPCSDSQTQRIEGGADALLSWLEQHPHLEAVDPRPRTVGGITGIQIDVTTPEQAEPCPTESDLHLIRLENPDHSVLLPPGDEIRLVVLDVPGGTVTFDMSIAAYAPDDLYERFLAEVDAVLDTVDFVEDEE